MQVGGDDARGGVEAGEAQAAQRHPQHAANRRAQRLGAFGERHGEPTLMRRGAIRQIAPRIAGMKPAWSACQLYLAISSRPTWSRWTSSGPSARRSVRWWAYMLASLNTWLTPPAPCSCRQRSTTLEVMFGTATLIIAICWRASLLPYLSIAQAALSTSRRAISISMRMSATWALVTPISEMRWPKATRLLARLIAISSARSATPM